MKILYLCADLGIPVLGGRGGSIHVRSLVAALVRAGHSVVVVSPLATKSHWDEPARIDAPFVLSEPSATTEAAARSLEEIGSRLGAADAVASEVRRALYNEDVRQALRRRFAASPPDVIYERHSLYGVAGAMVAEDLGVPLLLEVNAPVAAEDRAYRAGTGLGGLAEAAERFTLSRADAVFVVSSLLREHVLELGADPARVHVMPNGVDPTLFRPGASSHAVRERWGLDGGPVLGFVGGYQPWHGVQLLPALLERLLPRHPGLCLVVVGDGRGRELLEADVARRGLGASTIISGPVPHEDVPALIREFDVAVAPYSDPAHDFYFSPLKLFEYMSCGAAVAAPRLGQIEEIVRDGDTGLLYSPSDHEGLLSACDRLLSDPPLRRRLGQAAADAVRGEYTWDRNAARIGAIADSCVRQRSDDR